MFALGGEHYCAGYIIPHSVVSHFLREYQLHGTFRGCCSVGFRWQDMENNSLKEHFKVLTGALLQWHDLSMSSAHPSGQSPFE